MPLLGVLPRFMAAPLDCLRDAAHIGPVVALGPNTYFVNDLDEIKYILQENHRNYDRRDAPTFRKLRPLLGNGLVLNAGESWLQQRRLLQPAFQHGRLITTGVVPGMVETVAAMLEQWQTTLAPGATLDLAAELTRMAMHIIMQSMFSTDISGQSETLIAAMTFALAYMSQRVLSFITVPERWPTPHNRAFARAMHALDTFVYRIIAERRQSGNEMNDLLGVLLAARDAETGAGMSDRQLRDEVMTLFIAGHETAATTLAWAWSLIATHPEVERRLYTEVDAVLAGRTPTAADLSALTYTRQIIDETLRLYPAAWLVSRSPNADDIVGGYRVPAGAMIFLCPYIAHRNAQVWKNPDAFDPERFTPQAVASRPRHAYWPFGMGPRTCIGNYLAVMEAQISIAMIAQSYQLRLPPGAVVEPQAGVTLRPRDGMPMRMYPPGTVGETFDDPAIYP